MARYEKYCPRCGTVQIITPMGTFSAKDGKHHTWGYCYEQAHFVTKNPFNPKYEVQ